MIVCLCHRVSDRDIAHAVREGCVSFDELQDDLNVGTACGACGDCARHAFDAQRQKQAGSVGMSWLSRSPSRLTPMALAPQPAGPT